MIRTQVCWDATIRIVVGAVVVGGGLMAAEALVTIAVVGWLFAIGVAAPATLFGTFLVTKGLWLVVEAAAREAVEGAPRGESLTGE